MSKAFYVTLKNRGLIRIEGEERASFLSGLVSNDVAAATPDKIIYACLLTPQGKFLHDFFVHAVDGALLLDCEGGTRARDLYDRLLKYRLRAKVQLSVMEDNPVYAVIDTPHPFPLPDGERVVEHFAKTGEGDLKKDPRHPSLGFRSFTKPALDEKPFEEWDRLRISLTVPDGSRDMEVERSTLLECGTDKLNGIDWNKGCYMGQELTARMHYRGLAKKHLYTVTFSGPPPAPFTDLPNGGSMRSSCGDIGLALLKDGDSTCL
jgi:hypothetical protein